MSSSPCTASGALTLWQDFDVKRLFRPKPSISFLSFFTARTQCVDLELYGSECLISVSAVDCSLFSLSYIHSLLR